MNDDEWTAFHAANQAWHRDKDAKPQEHIAMFAAGIAYAQTWRSMESAPKDGTPILAMRAGFPEPAVAHYHINRDEWVIGRAGRNRSYTPTGWLPLPPTEVK